MATVFEPTPQPDLAQVPVMSAKMAAVRAALAHLLPRTIIGVGLVATLVWIGTIFWLSSRIILASFDNPLL
jgi:hypothetical protein